jgi:hypothetical protein
MKRILKTAIVAAGLVVGFSASAIQYRDTDLILSSLSAGNPYDGNFNIAAGDGDAGDLSGFNPLTQTIISATAGFTFLNSALTTSTVSIKLDSQALVSGGVIDQLLTSLNGSVVGTAYVSLNSSGSLNYTVELLSGDPVTLVMASLTAQVGDKVIGVPDGGTTLGMLGFGLLAAAWVCRRFRIGSVLQ